MFNAFTTYSNAYLTLYIESVYIACLVCYMQLFILVGPSAPTIRARARAQYTNMKKHRNQMIIKWANRNAHFYII